MKRAPTEADACYSFARTFDGMSDPRVGLFFMTF